MPNPSLLRALASSFLHGDASAEAIAARAAGILGRPWKWLRPLASRYLESFAGRTRPRLREVIQFLRDDSGFHRAESKYASEIAVEHWLAEPPLMQPAQAARRWEIPVIETTGDLADWLALTPQELDWYADLKALGSKQNRPLLRHYHYRLMEKRSGSFRLIEVPKPNLKAIQHRILTRILDRVPAHPAAHGFVRSRSIRTFVAPHTGARAVLRMDLRDFFPSFSGPRIQAFFRTLGYPERVADRLGGICTNAAARDAIPRELHELYARPHLPQGAPTSPSLANACMYRVDCRLAGLARAAGVRYTRYADDLAFSGAESFARFSTHVAAILHEEGFSVQHRKTRIMRQGVRQHLAGLVANQHVNVIRADFDALEATLTNCVRRGPMSQNLEDHPDFRAHLAGRIAFVASINAAKAQRLRSIFEHIHW